MHLKNNPSRAARRKKQREVHKFAQKMVSTFRALREQAYAPTIDTTSQE